MANNENLQPFTKENAKYYGKKGGLKSGIVRAEKKSVKEQIRLLLNMPVINQNKIDKLREAGFTDDEMNNQLLLTYTLFERALSGDVKATSLIIRIIQEEDNEKTNLKNDDWNSILGF